MKSPTRKQILLLQLLFVNIALLLSAIVYAQPVANFSCSNVSGCAPILVSFTDQSAGNPTQWKWDLGNGTVSYLQNPSVTYFNPGTYTVKLVIKSAIAADSVVKINYITVYGAPVINFSASQTAGCNQLDVNFKDQTTSAYGNLTEWKWDFGDGVLSDISSPFHHYNQTGDFNITLNVKNSYGCSSSLLKTAYIKVNGIKAAFSNAVPVRCSPNKITFTNLSTGTGEIKYKWYFGNGDTSQTKNPLYTYANGGNYTVKLFVNNQFGCIDSVIKTIKVDTPVSAAFTANNTKGCKAPFTVHFTNQQFTGNSFIWNMGDSSQSILSNPFHQYADTGNYTVKLVVKNVNGCTDSVTKINYIHVRAASLKLVNLPDSGCMPFTKKINVEFNPADSVLNMVWNFGDGTSSVVRYPVHTFNTEGYYTVSVIASTLSGCIDTIKIANAIRVSKRPKADFISDITNACAYKKISFTNLTSGDATRYTWEFNNNDVSYDKDPKYTFRDTGFVTVQMVAWNGGCSDTSTKTKLIYLQPSVSKLKYTFTCSDASKLFFNNHSLGADQWAWNFGDGTASTQFSTAHTYAEPGNYSVSLETWNHTTGCYYLQTLPVKIAQRRISFYASDSVICKRSEILFTANADGNTASHFIWDFGDGTRELSRQHTISHVYNKPGKYDVTMIVINSTNCNDTLVKRGYIRVNGPLAKFTTAALGTCYNKPVLFTDSSLTDGVNAIKSWAWSFGDGTMDTLKRPPFQHVYNKQGNYIVKLKLTDASGCSDSAKLSKPVMVIRPSAYILPYDTLGCTNKLMSLIAPYAEAGIAYAWDFGDGGTASTQLVKHAYVAEGPYTVKLIINNYLYGCADTNVKANLVRIEDPVAKFTMSDSFKACPPLMIQFTNESLNATDELWDFGDGSSTTTHTPSHFYSYPGVYTVTLSVKGRGGCTRQMQKQIIVKGPKGFISYNPFNICTQQQVGFNVQSTDAVSYLWDFNDGTTLNSTDTFALHTYTNAGGYMPKIMLMDEKGCKVPVMGKDTVQIRAPFKMAINKPGKVCIGQSKNLQAGGATSYQWSPSAGLDNDSTATPIAKPAVTTNYKVIGTDDKGCFTDTGYVMVEVAAFPKVNAGADKKIAAGVALDLVPSLSTDVTEVRWSTTGAIFRNSESAITVKPLENTEYTVEVKNAAGCAASDKVNVTVTKAGGELFIPNTFSPNADGVNDVFYPRSTASVKIISLKIINRYGALVFERTGFNTNDVNAGWDGNYRGAKLLPDIYLYVISITDAENNTQTTQGDIALIR